MATACPCPTATCPEKHRLDDAVWRIVRELLALQDQESAANDGQAFERILLARKLAIQRHDDATTRRFVTRLPSRLLTPEKIGVGVPWFSPPTSGELPLETRKPDY